VNWYDPFDALSWNAMSLSNMLEYMQGHSNVDDLCSYRDGVMGGQWEPDP